MTEKELEYKLLPDNKQRKVRFSIPPPKKLEPEVPDMNEEAKRKLIMVCCVCSCFMVIEFVGGLLANSLAIMTDAAHLLSDLAGFVISIFAIYISGFPANKDFTYGYHRAEIVGALISVFTIWVLTIMLFMESITRLIESHHEVNGLVMLITSSVGLVFNLIMVYILHSKGPEGGGCSHSHADIGAMFGLGHSHDHHHVHSDEENDHHCHGHGHGHSHDKHDKHDKHDYSKKDHHSQEHHSHDHQCSSHDHSHKHTIDTKKDKKQQIKPHTVSGFKKEFIEMDDLKECVENGTHTHPHTHVTNKHNIIPPTLIPETDSSKENSVIINENELHNLHPVIARRKTEHSKERPSVEEVKERSYKSTVIRGNLKKSNTLLHISKDFEDSPVSQRIGSIKRKISYYIVTRRHSKLHGIENFIGLQTHECSHDHNSHTGPSHDHSHHDHHDHDHDHSPQKKRGNFSYNL
jgi:hypothetical protein